MGLLDTIQAMNLNQLDDPLQTGALVGRQAAPVRAPIRVGRASDVPAAAKHRGRRALWIVAVGLVVVAAVAAVATWRILEPPSPVTAHTETPTAPVTATPATAPATPTESPSPPSAPVLPGSRPHELGPAGQILEEGLSKKPTATAVTPTPPPSPRTAPSTSPVAPDPVQKLAPPFDLIGTKAAPNPKRPPVALAPSPSRSPSTRTAKVRAARDAATKVAPPLDLIDKVHDR